MLIPISLTLFCAWVVAAAIIAMMPGRYHWPGAYALLVTVAPLLAFIWIDTGPIVALGCGIAAASVLRWPVRFAARWVQRQVARVRGQG